MYGSVARRTTGRMADRVALLNEKEGSNAPEGSTKEKRRGRGALRKDMNLTDAIAFVVGVTIGSGIFITPATILRETGSFGVSMLCWLVGMIVALVGSFCYMELGLLIPKTGGDYIYILHAYTFRKRNKWLESFGSLVAFLFTWSSIFITGPCGTAITSLTCAHYLTQPFFIGCEIPQGVLKTTALFIVGKTTQTVCDDTVGD